MNIFKRRTVEEKIELERERILEKYIKECRKAGFLDETILKKLRTINVSEEFLNKHFQNYLIKEVINSEIKSKQEVNPMPKQKEQDFEDEDQEIESNDEESEEDSEESDEEEKPKPVKKEKTEKKETKEPEITIADVLRNHEQRLSVLEASMFRLKSI